MSTMPDKKPTQRKWSPHMWEGCDFFAWTKLLAKNRFAVRPGNWYVAAIASGVSFGHTVLKWLQHGQYGRRIAETKIEQPPIFIIGHWRTGTTLLHELMILDQRFTFPNTYHCMVPHHFLLTESLAKRYLTWMLPTRRPMDNMLVGWDRPQEDEFAMCLMGQPSPYSDFAFPNHSTFAPGSLDLEGLSPRELREWKRVFYRYLRTLTFHDPRRLVLKSPPHTARIRHLLDVFPDAKFVHIMRNPWVVFSSTVNLWRKLYQQHALQRPTFKGLEEYVLNTFVQMYARLEEGRKLVPAGQFHELRYEELVADPIDQMQKLYDSLNLGEFENLRPRLDDYLQRNADYETNKFDLAPEWREQIRTRWADVIARYGYTEP